MLRTIPIVVALMTISAASPGGEVPRAIKRSDVVFPYMASAEVHRQYGATLVAWGFHPFNLSGQERVAEWRRTVAQAHSVGARYQARVELDAGWKGMIDYDPDFLASACRTLTGEPLQYRSWEGLQYKGHPPYQFCTNSPSLRAYLKDQLHEAMAAGPDMLLVDAIACSHMTIWRGGCFCQWCMSGFRKFLAQPEHAGALREVGVADLGTFDYGAFLRGRGVTIEQYTKEITWWPPKLPLAQEYLTFQHLANRGMLDELRVEAESIAGRQIPIGTSTPLREPRDWWGYPVADHFTIETMYEAGEHAVPTAPIFRLKLADALDRPVLSTGVPQRDFTLVRDEERPGLVRTWIAQAYALGHHFMVPHSMWCGAGEKSRYESGPGDCDYLYQFVRANDELFDGYEPVAQVGVLYSNTAFRRWKRQAQDVCIALTEKNVPCRLVVAGDNWMPKRLTQADVRDLQAFVVTGPTFLDSAQQAVIESVKERNVTWPDRERLFGLVPRQITLSGAEEVLVLPRAKPGDAHAPLVCHLLNTSYVPDSDSMQVKRDLTIVIADSLFGAKIARATLLVPGGHPLGLATRRAANGTKIAVPELDLWAVLKLERHQDTGQRETQRGSRHAQSLPRTNPP